MDESRVCRQVDARIARDVQSQLTDSPYPDTRCVVVECEDGVVVLRGEVGTYYYRQMAQSLAQHVDGVQSVVDHIVVRYTDVPAP
jgi:osmotically-inducible protein OsmY